MNKRRVIINADDFGLSKAVNDAVFDAAKNGVLTSATVMANMPAFEGALHGALPIKNLGVGVHLNLLKGSPLCNPADIPTLVDTDGNLVGSAATFLRMMLTGAIGLNHIELELEAQIERVLNSGITPTHLDSEKHIHIAFPKIGEIACRLAKKFGIPCIRVAHETICVDSRKIKTPLLRRVHYTSQIATPMSRDKEDERKIARCSQGYIERFFVKSDAVAGHWRPQDAKYNVPSLVSQRMKARFLKHKSRQLAHIAEKYNLRHADHFFGIALTGRMTNAVYKQLFKILPPGTTEIMTHPATGEDATQRKTHLLDHHRIEEYRALISAEVREALAENNIETINYSDI